MKKNLALLRYMSSVIFCLSLSCKSIPSEKPKNDIRITTSEKLNPIWWFQNTDEPVPPENYRPDDKHRTSKYMRRNPCHNFTFYVIGVADKKFTRHGKYPKDVFNPKGGWNFAYLKYKRLYLPFVSYSSEHLHFYIGWRERGNFGIKCN